MRSLSPGLDRRRAEGRRSYLGEPREKVINPESGCTNLANKPSRLRAFAPSLLNSRCESVAISVIRVCEQRSPDQSPPLLEHEPQPGEGHDPGEEIGRAHV